MRFVFIVGVWLLLALQAHAESPGSGLEISHEAGVFSIEASSTPGIIYELEQSETLQADDWTVVASVTAEADRVVFNRTLSPTHTKLFWRLVEIGPDGEVLSISPISATYLLDSGSNQAVMEVSTSSGDDIESVTFFDNGQRLGEADLLDGDLWVFKIEGEALRRGNLRARVTTTEGETEDTPINRFAIAPPSHFVPIAADGSLQYDLLIETDLLGNMQPFAFFPEGAGARASNSGAYFRFSSGARLVEDETGARLEFEEAEFFRGSEDTDPITVDLGGNPSTLDPNHLSPEGVRAALRLSTSTPLHLLWGKVPLQWEAGSLGEAGWSALQVKAPGMPDTLPENQQGVTIHGSADGDGIYLSRSFSGNWPVAGGFGLRVPTEAPLIFSISKSGAMTASGSAVITLPGGGELKGSLAWNDPHLEIRLAGRGIKIDALKALADLTPTGASGLVPDTADPALLDAATAHLRDYLHAYRATALNSQTESTATAAPSAAPSASNHYISALTAWAYRIKTWSLDRTGESLTAEQVTLLKNLLESTAKEVGGLMEVDGILSQWLAARKIEIYLPSASSDAELAAAASAASEACGQAALRFLAKEPLTENFGNIAERLNEIYDLDAAVAPVALAESPRKLAARIGTTQTATTLEMTQSAVGLLLISIDRFFEKSGLPRDASEFTGFDSNILLQNSFDGLLSILADLAVLQKLKEETDPSLNYNFRTAQALVLDALVTLNNAEYEAVRDKSLPFVVLNKIVKHRTEILLRADALNLGISGFDPATADLLGEYSQNLLQSLNSLPTKQQVKRYLEEYATAQRLAQEIDNPVLEAALRQRWLDLVWLNNQIPLTSKDAGALCAALWQDMEASGLTLVRAPDTTRMDGGVNLTGKYEQINLSDNTRVMLQLNQAERYFRGWYQKQIVDAAAKRTTLVPIMIEGFLLNTPEPAFGYRIMTDGGVVQERGTLVFNQAGTPLTVTLTPISGSPRELRRLSPRAPMPANAIRAFAGNDANIAYTSERFPLHLVQMQATETLGTAILTELADFFPAAAGRPASATNQAILDFGDFIVREMRQFPTQQQKLVGFHIQKFLQEQTITHGSDTRSAWEWLAYLYQGIYSVSPRGGELLGLSTTGNQNPHTYQVSVNAPDIAPLENGLEWSNSLRKNGLRQSASLINEAASALPGNAMTKLKDVLTSLNPLSSDFRSTILRPELNALFFTFDIKKTSPVAWDSSEHYILVGLSASAALVDVGFLSETGTLELTLPYDYSREDFAGFATFFNGTLASIAADYGTGDYNTDEAKTVIGLFGSDNFPVVDLDISDFNIKTGVEGSLGALELGPAWVFRTTEDAPLEITGDTPTFEIQNFASTTNVQLNSALHFESNSAELNSCGWQFLREFVAENRLFFDDPYAPIVIRGYTDSSGTSEYNSTLSQQRADAMANALRTLIDLPPSPDPDLPRIYSFGMGEVDARNALGDGVHSADWRRVEIEVGGIAQMNMTEARD